MLFHLMTPSLLLAVDLQVICWVLGEYGTTDGRMAPDDVLAKLCDISSSHEADDSVRVSTDETWYEHEPSMLLRSSPGSPRAQNDEGCSARYCSKRESELGPSLQAEGTLFLGFVSSCWQKCVIQIQQSYLLCPFLPPCLVLACCHAFYGCRPMS